MDKDIMNLLVKMDGKLDKLDTEVQATRQDIRSLTTNVAEMFEHSTKLFTDNVEPLVNDVKYIDHKVLQLEKELFSLRNTQ